MAQTRFQLTTEGTQFMKNGAVSFRVGFTKTENGSTRYCSQKACPVIEAGSSDVLGTNDDWAASNLALMKVPNRTSRGGSKKASGLMFDDVTASTVSGDVTVDLDAIFSTV